MDDRRLMELVTEGNRDAFTVLVRRHWAAIVQFAQRYLGQPPDAEDVAQEAFTRLWCKARSWHYTGLPPVNWLYRITYNLCIDVLRGRHPQIAIDEIAEPQAPDTPDRSAETTAEIRQLLDALGKLPERQYTAIVLCAVQGLSNQEAAGVMDIKVRALESLLARGRRKLKKLLQT